jgi:hypothetical protein
MRRWPPASLALWFSWSASSPVVHPLGSCSILYCGGLFCGLPLRPSDRMTYTGAVDAAPTARSTGRKLFLQAGEIAMRPCSSVNVLALRFGSCQLMSLFPDNNCLEPW